MFVRICMLNDNFYRGSGVNVAIQRIVKTPAFQGAEIYFAGCESIGGNRSLQEDKTVVSTGRYRYFPLMGSGLTLLSALYSFAKWVKEMRIDVLHAHHRRLAALANLMRPFTSAPVLYTGHSTFPDELWFRQLAPRTATGVSPSVVEYLRCCTKTGEVKLIYNPIDFHRRETALSATSRTHVASVGRLERGKGHEILLEAWFLLRQKGIDAQLDIFGEGSLRTLFENQILQRNLQDCVRLCGFASEIAELLPKYEFNVLVS
jgi:glycosyltransferase involved in cell wall biosynthesis